jgi:hypothetical protein
MRKQSRRGLWRDIIGVALVLSVTWIVLVVFHRLTELGRSLSNDYYAVVGTTLFAAALGFGAVMLQLRAQQRAAEEDEERRRSGVAKALLAEIEDWENCFLPGVQKTLADIDSEKLTKQQLPWLGSPSSNPFEVYRGNVSKIGDFNYGVVTAVTAFYKTSAEHLRAYEDYRTTLDRLNTPNETPETLEEARYCLKQIKAFIPTVINSANKARLELRKLID